MDYKEIKEWARLSNPKISALSGIPVQTLKNWSCGKFSPPQYVLDLLVYRLDNRYDDMQHDLFDTFSEMKDYAGITLREFSETYDIPMPTLLQWSRGNNVCNKYIIHLIWFHFKSEQDKAKNNK